MDLHHSVFLIRWASFPEWQNVSASSLSDRVHKIVWERKAKDEEKRETQDNEEELTEERQVDKEIEEWRGQNEHVEDIRRSIN
jgi:hypothetical protein